MLPYIKEYVVHTVISLGNRGIFLLFSKKIHKKNNCHALVTLLSHSCHSGYCIMYTNVRARKPHKKLGL